MGKNLSMNDLIKVKKEINRYFKEKGEVFTKVELLAQDLSDNTLKFLLIKAKVGKINIEGNKFYKADFIKSRLDLKEGENLDYGLMVKSLLLMNEHKDLSVKSYLKKGSSLGQTDINLQVEDERPTSLETSFDNFGSEDTSKYRFSANFFYGNLLNDGDEMYLDTTLGIDSIKENNTKLFRFNYISTDLEKYHTRFNFGYLYANYVSAGDFEVLDLKGDTNIYTFGFTQPVIRSQTDKLDFALNYYKKDIKSYLLGAISTEDYLRILDLTLSYQKARAYDTFGLVFNFSKGIDGDGEYGSRIFEEVRFDKVVLSTNFNRYINETNSFLVTFHAQYTKDRLPLSEMFTLGGLSSVRGYDSAYKMGDFGWNGSFEWFYMPKFDDEIFKNSTKLGVFLDYGEVFVNEPVLGEDRYVSSMGAGVEVIANIDKKYFGRVAVGFPVKSSEKIEDNSARIYAYIGAKLW